MRTLKVLFLDEPTNRYAAEKRLVIAVTKTSKAASCSHWQKPPHAHWKEPQATSRPSAMTVVRVARGTSATLGNRCNFVINSNGVAAPGARDVAREHIPRRDRRKLQIQAAFPVRIPLPQFLCLNPVILNLHVQRGARSH